MPLIQQRQSRAFKDISLSFKKHPVTNDIISLTNENAIKRSDRNLVETINQERFFNPLTGSHVKETQIEQADSGLLTTIKTQIETTINNFEPRVALTDVSCVHPPNTNNLEVSVSYDIIGQEAQPQEITFILQSTRE